MRSMIGALGLIAMLAEPSLLAAQQAPAGEPPPLVREDDPATAPPPGKKGGVPAKVLFGAVKTPAPLAARAIGFYSRGCLAGGQPLAIDGNDWQVMRLSRNRNWGHPALIRWLERFAKDVRSVGWPGLLVGDLAQPRGGPMLTGRASHQIGLDADIWLTPMPNRRLSATEREELSATSMLGADITTVNPQVWTRQHVGLISRAAGYPEVERVLVHPAIKKALCVAADAAPGGDRSWLHKVRPYWGHHYHMHVRMACPPDSPTCRPQAPTTTDDGCGKELDDWFKLLTRPPKPPGPPPVKPVPPPPQITLDQLPPECRVVINAGSAPAR